MAEIEAETAIVGAGQAGVPLARALAGAEWSTALIERAHLGGSCVNFGCTPSKAIIASARLAHQARRAAEWGVRIPTVEVDFAAVMDRARRIVGDSVASLEAGFRNADNPRVIRAHARLDGRDGERFRLRAGDDVVLAERVVLDTGTRTAYPPVEGLDRVPCLDAESWIEARELPRRLVFLGGGYITLEMAQTFRRFGAEVTVLERGDRLMAREDPDVSEELRRALEREGVDVRFNAEAGRVEPAGAGVRVHLKDGDTIEADRLFVAAGRKPNTDDLGLETVGVKLDERGHVEVDERLRTSVPGVWAAGDIRGGAPFTHTAYDDSVVLKSQLVGDGSKTTRRIVGYAVFTEPELGRVGLSETEARQAGREIKVGRLAMTDSGKAREIGRTEGFIKVVADAGSGEILGAAALCESGSEVVQLFVELMNAGATTRTMIEAVHIHPTLAEAAKNAVATIEPR